MWWLSLCKSTIGDKSIPHDVSLFTGEAVQRDEFKYTDAANEEDDSDGNATCLYML